MLIFGDLLYMPTALEQITKDAMNLAPLQKLALAAFLFESTEDAEDPGVGAAWESEIQKRICAIDEGRVIGISYDEVMHAAEEQILRAVEKK